MDRPAISISRRLMVSLALANAVLLLMAAGLYLWRGYAANEGEMIDHLKERALEVAMLGLPSTGEAAAVFDAESGVAVPGSHPELVAHLPKMIGRGLTDGVLSFSTDQGPHYVAVATVERDGGAAIGAVLHRGKLPAELWEWIGHEILSDVLPIFVPLFVITLGVSALTVRRAMAPLTALSRQASEVGPAHLDIRLYEDGVPAEVYPLVQAINAGLVRVEAGFDSQRRFTANAAHELRTPLAVLKARLEQVADADLRRRLIADADRMARVVDQLLTVARLEARGLEMEGPVELAPLAEQVVADMFPLAQRSGRGVGLETHALPVLALGNAASLYDALRNLVENAIRVTPEGEGVDVEVGPGAVIRVLDSGPGVPATERDAIFEPFYRGPGSKGGGAGLGLNIAREAVRLHGGTLSVDARPGGGTIFAMEFPTP